MKEKTIKHKLFYTFLLETKDLIIIRTSFNSKIKQLLLWDVRYINTVIAYGKWRVYIRKKNHELLIKNIFWISNHVNDNELQHVQIMFKLYLMRKKIGHTYSHYNYESYLETLNNSCKLYLISKTFWYHKKIPPLLQWKIIYGFLRFYFN